MKRNHLWLGLIILLTLIAYSQTFDNPPYFDTVKQFDRLENWPYIWRRGLLISRSFGNATFVVNYLLHGTQVFGYHLVNFVLHIFSILMSWRLAQDFAKLPNISKSVVGRNSHHFALAVAAVFALHPLQTQAVTYIVQRYAVLGTLFYLVSAWLWIQFRVSQKKSQWGKAARFLTIALLCWVLGVFSKEIVVTAPLIWITIELLGFGNQGILKYKQGLLGLVIALVTVTPFIMLVLLIQWPHTFVPKIGDNLELITISNYALSQITVIPRYIRLLFAPINQSFVNEVPLMTQINHPHVLMGIGFLVINFLLWLYSLLKKHFVLAFGIAWIVISLSTTSSFIVIEDLMFEHRVYIAMFGFGVLVSALLVRLPQKFFLPVLIVLSLTYTGLTYRRNLVWNSPQELWGDVIAKHPDSPKGYFNLGVHYQLDRDDLTAQEYYEKALEADPNYPRAMVNLALIKIYFEEYEEAGVLLDRALELKPGFPGAVINKRVLDQRLEEE